MKEFRKTEDGLFICEECNKTFVRVCGLSLHIKKKYSHKEYYDKWLKEDNEGICKICGKETKYVGRWHKHIGYANCCSNECTKKYRRNKINITSLIKYGFASSLQNKKIREKIKQTFINNYGVDHNWKNKTIHEKCLNNAKKTCIKKYNVENPMQNKNIFEKNQNIRFKIKYFKNTNIHYQGSYELDFLEKYYNLFPDLQNADSIKYTFNGQNHIYYPDFYIPSLNLIIECKNSYLTKKDKDKIETKEKATITNGFNYILIVNKNYIIEI